MGHDTAILAGGCFWCLEAVFAEVRGVRHVESGYIGGQTPAPDYEAVCTGMTGHAEAVRIDFDPAEVSYRELLEIFFVIHDPTQLNRQGNDVGTQYRSAIFWQGETQRAEAQRMLDELSANGAYAAPVVTQCLPAGEFFPAEAYHRDYYVQHPMQPYCAFVVAPKLEKFRKTFARLRKSAD